MAVRHHKWIQTCAPKLGMSEMVSPLGIPRVAHRCVKVPQTQTRVPALPPHPPWDLVSPGSLSPAGFISALSRLA